jgi:hypothetical protein
VTKTLNICIKVHLCYLYSIVKYYMNKKHWNTILLDGFVPNKEIQTWIDHSYELVKSSP